MSLEANRVEIYVEVGKVRTFAIVPDWPGWCRSGRDEASALKALFDYGPRYESALKGTQLIFHAPCEISALVVAERLPGNATTNFGAPDLALAGDIRPVDPPELECFQTVLDACWRTFDEAVQLAMDKTLRMGPRGGGRDLERMIEHVRDVDIVYLKNLGGDFKSETGGKPHEVLTTVRQTILSTLAFSARGEISARGPRGGIRWTPRYFVRRLAWHELDHVWEIEDRAE